MMVGYVLRLFEGIAKTNTTHTILRFEKAGQPFEGIAKTNTTHTSLSSVIKNTQV